MRKKKARLERKEQEVTQQGQKAAFVKSQANALRQALSSFRSRQFLRVLLFDAAFLISVVVLILCVNFLVNMLSEPLLPDLANVADLRIKEDPAYAEAFAQIEPSVVKVLWQSLGIIAAAYLLGVLLASLLYSKAWSVAKGEQLNFKRMLLLNLEWFSAWLLLMFLSLAIFPDQLAQALFLIELFLLFYLDFIMRARYSGGESITKNLLGAFKLFFSRVHHFIGYVVIVPLAYFLLFAVLGLFAGIDWLFFTLLFLFNLLFLGFARSYAICLIKEFRQANAGKVFEKKR